jgi:hypothetical protein
MARKSGPITTEQLTVVPANEASWDDPRHMSPWTSAHAAKRSTGAAGRRLMGSVYEDTRT